MKSNSKKQKQSPGKQVVKTTKPRQTKKKNPPPERVIRRIQQNKKRVLENLEIYKGIITTAAAASGVDRTTVYEWIKDDAEFAEAVDLVREMVIDFAESKLIERIEGVTIQKEGDGGPNIYQTAPDVTAIIFYLKTIGKKRGYVERQEIQNLNPTIVFEDATGGKKGNIEPPKNQIGTY